MVTEKRETNPTNQKFFIPSFQLLRLGHKKIFFEQNSNEIKRRRFSSHLSHRTEEEKVYPESSFTRRVQTQESRKKYHFIFVRAREPSRAEAEPLYGLTSGRRFQEGTRTPFFIFTVPTVIMISTFKLSFQKEGGDCVM